MKKVLALLLACVLTLGMSVTALASSPGGQQNPGPGGSSPQGTVVTFTADTAYTPEELEAVKAIEKDAAGTLETVVGTDAAKGMSLLSVFDVEIEDWDFSKGPATVTFDFPSVNADSKVIVLHFTAGKWQQETAKAGEGTITVTLSSASPLAVFVEKSASEGITSPKTGAAPVMTIIVVAAALAVAGMAVSTKRKHV